jgi:hypothetical protein
MSVSLARTSDEANDMASRAALGLALVKRSERQNRRVATALA